MNKNIPLSLAFLLGVIISMVGMSFTHDYSYRDSYWDSQALIDYLFSKHTDYRQTGWGNGHIRYEFNNTIYEIRCDENFIKDSVYNNCVEGIPKLGSYGEFLGWEEVMYNGTSRYEEEIIDGEN